MNTGTILAAPTKRCDLQDEFLRLVYADDQFVREEFDALIADVWGDGQQSESGRGAAHATARPPSHGDPSHAVSTLTSLPADPLIERLSRQRSPPV